MPLVLVASSRPTSRDVLTGQDRRRAGRGADALPWIVPAAARILFAGLAASALAALDDYAPPPSGTRAGSIAGLAAHPLACRSDGIVAVAWGMALNGAIALCVPRGRLVVRAVRTQMPAGAIRPSGLPLRERLGTFAAAASLPFALQVLYVVCLPFAARLGTGAVTSFGYAYLAAASLVAVTAFSLGLVTSVPLTRAGLEPAEARAHRRRRRGSRSRSSGPPRASSRSRARSRRVGARRRVRRRRRRRARPARRRARPVDGRLGRRLVAFPLALRRGSNTAAAADRGRRARAAGAARLGRRASSLDLDGLALALAVTTGPVLVALLGALGRSAARSRGSCSPRRRLRRLWRSSPSPPALVLGRCRPRSSASSLYVVARSLARPRASGAAWAYAARPALKLVAVVLNWNGGDDTPRALASLDGDRDRTASTTDSERRLGPPARRAPAPERRADPGQMSISASPAATNVRGFAARSSAAPTGFCCSCRRRRRRDGRGCESPCRGARPRQRRVSRPRCRASRPPGSVRRRCALPLGLRAHGGCGRRAARDAPRAASRRAGGVRGVRRARAESVGCAPVARAPAARSHPAAGSRRTRIPGARRPGSPAPPLHRSRFRRSGDRRGCVRLPVRRSGRILGVPRRRRRGNRDGAQPSGRGTSGCGFAARSPSSSAPSAPPGRPSCRPRRSSCRRRATLRALR